MGTPGVEFSVVNATIDTILDKAVGSEKTEHAVFLLYQLKRVLPQSGHLKLVANHLEKAKNYDEITDSQKKNYRKRLYPIFDTFLVKISGSSEIETQRKFLSSRFQSIHGEKQSYEPLSTQAS